MSNYLGVYSETIATTNIGTELELTKATTDSKLRKLKVKKEFKSDRHTFTSESLSESNLNVAKIRVVSTIPNKDVEEELRGKAFVGFILTEVQESHNEKVELVPLPGDTFASYFYGGSPRQFNFNGVLLNTDQDQWRDSFEQMYEKYLRGSASSREFNIVQVRYGGRIVSGWLTNMSQQLTSQSDLFCQFSFTVLVSRVDLIHTRDKSKYKTYLVEEIDSFKGANLDSDYSILDPSNFNAMLDPIRTGTVVPPKRPKRGGGKRRSNNSCGFSQPVSSGGTSNNNGSVTISNHVKSGKECLVFDSIANYEDKIRDKTKEIEEETKLVRQNKSNRDRVEKLIAEKDNLENKLRNYLTKKEVKQAMALQAEGILAAQGGVENLNDIPVSDREKRLGNTSLTSRTITNKDGKVARVWVKTEIGKDGKPKRSVTRVQPSVLAASRDDVGRVQSDKGGRGGSYSSASSRAENSGSSNNVFLQGADVARQAMDAVDQQESTNKAKAEQETKKNAREASSRYGVDN